MNAEIKAKWLEALRGGAYRKSINILKRHYKTKPGHCCLGVLCEIIKEDFPHAATLIDPSIDQSCRTKKSRFAMLDHDTLQYTGVASGQQRRLSTMNDSGAPFSKIADYIERYL